LERGSFKIVAIGIGEHVVGKALRELIIPLRTRIISIFNGEEFIDPDPDYTLKNGDTIIMLTHVDDIKKLEEILG
jgi:Trk K+ transport system NAD-binding subunit